MLLSLIAGSGWLVAGHFLAANHLRAARTAMDHRRLALARNHLERALSYRPGNVDAHLLAARLARWLNQPAEAEQHLDHCRRLQRGESEETQLERYMLRAQFGDIDAVYAHLWSYVAQKKPQAPLVLEALCLGHLLNSQTPQARTCALRWQDLAPDDPQAHYCEGLCYQRHGVLGSAKDCFARSLELDPSRADARLRLAQVYLDLNQEKEAAELFAEVLRQQPEQAEALVGLARCQRGLGNLRESRQLLEELLAQHAQEAAALAELGCVAFDEGNLAEAERLLRRAIALEPINHHARFQLVNCLRRLGRAADAQREDEGRQRVEKDFSRIQVILTKELIARPADPRLHYEVASLLYRHGKKRAAVQWLHTTLKHAPGHRPSHALLAAYYREKGEEEMAEHHQKFAGSLILSAPAPF